MSNPFHGYTRRGFVALGAKAAASAVMLSVSGGARRAEAATSGYKALVCLYLAGGNNGFNMVVPTSTTAYGTYARSRGNLALPAASLLPLSGTASDGYGYGLHPSCPELRSLFEAGHLAIMANVGTLVQPTTVVEARAASVPLPLQLYSHLDQQTAWMTSIPDQLTRTGWAGRVADYFVDRGYTPGLAVNVSVGGANYWQEGRTAIPYALGIGGAPLQTVTNDTFYRGGRRAETARALIAQAADSRHLMIAEYADILINAQRKVGLVNEAIADAGDVPVSFPSFVNDDGLGAQLLQVARCINAHARIGDTRQIFFVELGGFDTHNAELATQADRLKIVSRNLYAFWRALDAIGLRDAVTLFTASDFGRSLGSNGDGSDHAWGNHHLVMGGAVRGGYHGTMPNLAVGGPDDVGAGRILPTTSTDQYAATLAKWFGVDGASLDTVFPNLRRFAEPTLGFLG